MTEERIISRWFHLLPEKEAKQLVSNISGSLSYGLVKPYYDLPEQAKEHVRVAYRVHVANLPK